MKLGNFLCAAALLLSPAIWADSSHGDHVHSTGLGDANGAGAISSFVFSSPPAPPSVAAPSLPAAPPPPPAPPVQLHPVSVVKGSGWGVQSRVQELGEPGEARPRPIRTISGIYDGQAPSEAEPTHRFEAPAMEFFDAQ